MVTHDVQEAEIAGARQGSEPAKPTHESIASLAYALWLQRGCPEGTAEEDWFRAERELTAQSA
jgi:hypothetical protein